MFRTVPVVVERGTGAVVIVESPVTMHDCEFFSNHILGDNLKKARNVWRAVRNEHVFAVTIYSLDTYRVGVSTKRVTESRPNPVRFGLL